MALNLHPVLPPFKRGDTFMFSCLHKVDGAPASVAEFAILAQIRTRLGVLVATLVPVVADQSEEPGRFYLRPEDADTSGWPVGRHSGDIQITEGGVTRSTATFTLPVVEDMTR
jgi:hypothetical protein